MHLLIVHPGAQVSTSDVYDGLVAGLRALDGVTVSEARLDTICNWYHGLIQDGIRNHVLDQDAIRLDGTLNRSALTSAHITRLALLLRPDWVVVVSGHNYNAHDARALSRAGIKTAILLTESPYWTAVELQMAAYYDIAFTNERTMPRVAPDLHYLPHAWHPERHTPDGLAAEPCDALFVGSIFPERADLFGAVDWTGIDMRLRGMLLPGGASDIVDNAEVAAAYRAARVSINHHRTTLFVGSGEHIPAGAAESLNPRAYEIPACGGFMLCDDSRAELQDVFGGEAPTYRAGDSADLERQIRHYLARPDARARIAQAMHAAVQPHSWTARARHVMEVLA